VKGRETIGVKTPDVDRYRSNRRPLQELQRTRKVTNASYTRNAQRLLAVATDRRKPFNNDAIEPPSELHRHAKIDRR
jgi:hypothetical protein